MSSASFTYGSTHARSVVACVILARDGFEASMLKAKAKAKAKARPGRGQAKAKSAKTLKTSDYRVLEREVKAKVF